MTVTLPPVPNVLKFQAHWTIGADVNAATIWHWLYTGAAPDAADCLTLATEFDGYLADFAEPLMDSENVLTGVTCTDLASTSGAQAEFEGTDTGTRSGGLLPAGVALLVNYQIARRYRGGKPRSYLPFGVSSDLASQSLWSGSFTGAVRAGYLTFQTAIDAVVAGSTDLSKQVNVSYFEGFTNEPYGSPTKYRRVPTLRSGGPLVDPVTGVAVNVRPSSQRRRNLHSQ